MWKINIVNKFVVIKEKKKENWRWWAPVESGPVCRFHAESNQDRLLRVGMGGAISVVTWRAYLSNNVAVGGPNMAVPHEPTTLGSHPPTDRLLCLVKGENLYSPNELKQLIN